MAFYTEEEIDEFVENITAPKGDAYVRAFVKVFGPELERNPRVYKTFGVYWWAVKQALAKYHGNSNAWFMGGYEDSLTLERNWHGSLFRTIVAAAAVSYEAMEYSSDHSYEHRGAYIPYTLVDQDAGY